MYCPNCGREVAEDDNFCRFCGNPLRGAPPGDQITVGGGVGPGSVAGSGRVEAENIAGRDVIGAIYQYYDVNSDLELEKALRERLFTDGAYKNRDDVERWVTFYRARGKTPDLANARLSRVRLTSIDLNDADLYRADLTGADLSVAKLRQAYLLEATLRDAMLNFTDLSGANLYGADLRGASLVTTSLRGATLIEANFEGVAFVLTFMEGADLARANLRGVQFSASVNLSGANLSGADLTGAQITAEQLAAAQSLEGAIMPDGSVHP